ncbi:MAG: hypothetical protein KJ042_09165 [Deltaproteobacteria bacterium]|nr:hypothetical protein [Deltaproteobacteria bacterium]
MPGPFVIGAGASAFLSGIQIISGKVSFGTKGQSDSAVTNVGVLLAPTTGKPEVTIDSPVFAGNPMDLLKISQELVGIGLVLNLFDRVNAKLYTTTVFMKDEDFSFDEEKAATYKVSLNCTRIVPM